MPRTSLLALAAVAALAATPAGAAPARTVQGHYRGAVGTQQFVATILPGPYEIGSTDVRPKAGERWVHLTAADSSGLPIWFTVLQDARFVDGNADTNLGEFCGSTPKPVRLRSDVGTITVFPRSGPSPCGVAVSVPTTGVVTARFTR